MERADRTVYMAAIAHIVDRVGEQCQSNVFMEKYPRQPKMQKMETLLERNPELITKLCVG